MSGHREVDLGNPANRTMVEELIKLSREITPLIAEQRRLREINDAVAANHARFKKVCEALFAYNDLSSNFSQPRADGAWEKREDLVDRALQTLEAELVASGVLSPAEGLAS